MKNAFKLGTSLVAFTLLVGVSPVAAQSIVGGESVAAERNEALTDAIADDAERELARFGNEGRPQGFTGSFALRASAATGNSDSVDVGVGTDLNYVWGPNGIELQLNYAYGETDGEKTEESLYYGLEYTRDFTPAVYGFGKVQGSVDAFSDFESDTFLSFGAGYRILNDDSTQWSVQAGPGYRVAEIDDALRGDISEYAIGVSSDYAQRITENVYLTNDTDVIWSESDTAVFNDLALSVSVTEQLALRTSILTEYHSEVRKGMKNTDNTFGVSLVYAFN
ncbi:DUF481 domain-containing protein [Pseudaestuariivita sp.]|uniref:DUF481 domain-containing protein n=1 Tax=Pseudaestuariivita sp. TaxID=2211669 RepID=UPI004059B9ED